MILGLDIGGANTKAASSDGRVTESMYFPLWRGVSLGDLLKGIEKRHHPRAVAVVMTGELADCFPDKMTGISSIVAAVQAAFPCPVYFWGLDGFVGDATPDLAAANWSASATLVAAELGDCIMADMGSTTTDLIPINGLPAAGRTDFQRLARGELIYTGMLRTNLAALLREVVVEDSRVPLASELFAVTADVYRVLGEIDEEEYTCETPDGLGKSIDDCLRRLARIVCADLEEIGTEGARTIALQARDAQMDMLMEGLARVSKGHSSNWVAGMGIGEALLCRASQALDLTFISLSERYGGQISRIFPAYAAARLLEVYYLS